MEITLKAKNTDSRIIIENNILDKINVFTNEFNCRKIFIVTDENVYKLYFNKIENILINSGYLVFHKVLKSGEASKSLENLNILYGECVKNGITRSDLIIALGGGVIGDITGFLAATYLRGVPLIQIPTTLLAQIDSSVGGKTAVNLEFGKNLAGAFYQPKTVLIDPETLNSLDDSTFSDGLAEAVKYAYIKDKEMLNLFSDSKGNILDIIEKCVTIKKNVVSGDEFDRGERMILNFGHTIGHAIEKAGNYTEYTHGQAVSLGMVAAAEISFKLGYKNLTDNLKNILRENNLPVKSCFKANDCLKYIKNDKKLESENLNAVLLKDIGDCFIHKINVDEFIELSRNCSIWIGE